MPQDAQDWAQKQWEQQWGYAHNQAKQMGVLIIWANTAVKTHHKGHASRGVSCFAD